MKKSEEKLQDALKEIERLKQNLFTANTINSTQEDKIGQWVISEQKGFDLIKSFMAIAERKGIDTHWDGILAKCKEVLMPEYNPKYNALQKPVSEEKHYNTKVVKGKDLKVGDIIWYAQEFKQLSMTDRTGHSVLCEMLKTEYSNDLFLVQISHKEQ